MSNWTPEAKAKLRKEFAEDIAKGRKLLKKHKIKFTLEELEEAAEKAGHRLFDKHRSGLIFCPVNSIELQKLSELRKGPIWRCPKGHEWRVEEPIQPKNSCPECGETEVGSGLIFNEDPWDQPKKYELCKGISYQEKRGLSKEIPAYIREAHRQGFNVGYNYCKKYHYWFDIRFDYDQFIICPECGKKWTRKTPDSGFGDCEYIFFPSKPGEGLSPEEEDVLAATLEWFDTDHRIYTYWADGVIRIVEK